MGGATRLIARQRLTFPDNLSVMWHVVEPISFVMERQMLRGIKKRAEGPSPRRLSWALAVACAHGASMSMGSGDAPMMPEARNPGPGIPPPMPATWWRMDVTNRPIRRMRTPRGPTR